MDYGKKFIIIGNKNAIHYKDIFPYIKNNELWLGCTITSGGRWFKIPSYYETRTPNVRTDENGDRYVLMPGVCWFTNVHNYLRNLPLDLYKKYNAEEYPKYDNYNAIEVSKTKDIPMDYDGVMGVPDTFMFKYCPEQFEIINLAMFVPDNPNFGQCFKLNGKTTYSRILIKHKKPILK